MCVCAAIKLWARQRLLNTPFGIHCPVRLYSLGGNTELCMFCFCLFVCLFFFGLFCFLHQRKLIIIEAHNQEQSNLIL